MSWQYIQDNIDDAILHMLFDEYSWRWYIIHNPDGTHSFQTSEAETWQRNAANLLLSYFDSKFSFSFFYTYAEDPDYSRNDFVMAIPRPKTLDSFMLKLHHPQVQRPSHIFDYLRFTLIGNCAEVCSNMQERLDRAIADYTWFAPLDEDARRLRTKTLPQTTSFVNEHSAQVLKDAIERGYATTTRFQIGPNVIEHPLNGYYQNPLPGTRMEVSIITQGIWELLNDPASPAHHSHYAIKKNVERYMAHTQILSTPHSNVMGYMLLSDYVFEGNTHLVERLT